MFNNPRSHFVVLTLLLSFVLLTPLPGMAGLVQSYQASGNLHLEVAGAAGLGNPAMGTFTLATMPQGTIKKAYFYANQTNNTLGLTATFNGNPLPLAGPYDNEALLITISTYRWDVTPNIVPGVLSYGFSILWSWSGRTRQPNRREP